MNAVPRLGGEGVELVVNWGLGVDSTAYMVKMLKNPAAHGVDLDRAVVLHELTGDEWPATRAHADIGKSGYWHMRNEPLSPMTSHGRSRWSERDVSQQSGCYLCRTSETCGSSVTRHGGSRRY
ncbi:hypothetical protein OHA02_50210 [Streptomyces phaeochromogenes]|nr:hypothetical protein [Streptomyces phaeochromogenes]